MNFTHIISHAALGAMALAGALAFTQPAMAGSVKLGIHGHGGSIIISDGGIRYQEPRYSSRRHDDYRRGGHDRRGHHGRSCHPRLAVEKARDHGVRHARVDRINDRFVVVEGRGRRGADVKIGFERNSRRCDVAWVKRFNDGGHGDRGRRHGYRY